MSSLPGTIRISLTSLTQDNIISLFVGKSLRKVMPRSLLTRYILRNQCSYDTNLNQIKPFQNSTSPAIRYCFKHPNKECLEGQVE